MTVGEIKAALENSDLSDNDRVVVTAQDGSVWEDLSLREESINGEMVALVELVGDGDDSFGLGGDDEDIEYITETLEGMEDDDF